MFFPGNHVGLSCPVCDTRVTARTNRSGRSCSARKDDYPCGAWRHPDSLHITREPLVRTKTPTVRAAMLVFAEHVSGGLSHDDASDSLVILAHNLANFFQYFSGCAFPIEVGSSL